MLELFLLWSRPLSLTVLLSKVLWKKTNFLGIQSGKAVKTFPPLFIVVAIDP